MGRLIAHPAPPIEHPCIFCGARTNSEEDAWPKWLIRLMKTISGQDIILIDRSVDGIQKRPMASIRVPRAVCRKRCNNGWMSGLEKDAIPILTPLITDQPGQTSSLQQLVLSVWATKCAMIFDCIGDKERFYESVDTVDLFRTQMPPRSVFSVWLARSSVFRAYTHASRLNGIDRNTGRLVKGNVLTMAFGHVVMQVVAFRGLPTQLVDPFPMKRLDARSGPWQPVDIWPTTLKPVIWPIAADFDADLDRLSDFAERFVLLR